MARKLEIYFHAVDVIGHINACVGMGQALADRGHHITFLTVPAFKDYYSKYGFEEIILPASPQPPDAGTEDPVKAMSKQILDSGIITNKTPLEKALMNKQTGTNNKAFRKKFNDAKAYHETMVKVLREDKPDVVVVDHYFLLPSIVHSGIPWVIVESACPLCIFDGENLPPYLSGLSINEKEKWGEFRQAVSGVYDSLFGHFQQMLFEQFGHSVSTRRILSPYLNLYGYPAELDYEYTPGQREKCFRIDAYIRNEADPFELPAEFRSKIQAGDRLIYISMGSMGSVNVDLMRRLVEAFGDSPYKCIVSKGPRGDEFPLPENMWGQNYLPQIQILPLVDLVVTHGGNNTTTETFSSGKPMIVLPLFADQFDNAQRVQDTGFGFRLNPFEFTREQMLTLAAKLLGDQELKQRLEKARIRIAESKSKEKACEAIESLAK